ncbi:MAG: hypothetical protein M3N19_00055 [Candidatus Eremiobacteraeota bacterium]|nr:hypothetical protein [Candidatus Eremiobacteraeota bacterium]
MRHELTEGEMRFGVNAVILAVLGMIVAVIGWFIGIQLTQIVFWPLSLGFLTLAIFQRKRLNAWLITLACVGFFASCSGSVSHDAATLDKTIAAQNRAAAQSSRREHERQVVQNHNRRLAWNLAHPSEAVRLKVEARKKNAAKSHNIERVIASATINTPDGDVIEAFPSQSAFCQSMSALGNITNSTNNGDEIIARSKKVNASLGVINIANGSHVSVLADAVFSCPSSSLKTYLSLVRNDQASKRGWVFSNHLNPER